MDMAQGENQGERPGQSEEEITESEKEFLKDLYGFMKKRDSPIERIPNLGFKQIDLFVMFKTVRDFGGYQQVTAQQLWKQVYNMLGGNPRSTSAATCTRRHYEKLLLPYECHVRGISVNILPQHQSKNFHYGNYSRDDDGPMPAKRMLTLPMYQQNMHSIQSDHYASAFSLQMQYPTYFQPSHMVLPPHVPISSSVMTPHSSPAPPCQFSFAPYPPTRTESVAEPLEHLRFLAERYKTSSGLIEPLNLSVKAQRQEASSSPASSFALPPSGKNPRFLNKPSPLYSPRGPPAVMSERSEARDGEATLGEASRSYPAKAREAHVVDVEDVPSRPVYDGSVFTPGTNEGAAPTSPKPASPKTDLAAQLKDGRAGSPDVREQILRQILPNLPQDDGRGDMEIEIPLSVFNSWLRLCRSSAGTCGDKPPDVPPGQSNGSDADAQPANLTFRTHPQICGSVDEDQRPRQRGAPSPSQTAGGPHGAGQSPFTSYRPLPAGGVLKSAASRDVYPADQQDVSRPYRPDPPHYWDIYSRETPTQTRGDPQPEAPPSAVLMLNSGAPSLLHLTSEEVMKLKKIISSSS